MRSAKLAADEIPIVIGAGAVGLSAVAALRSRGIDLIIVSDYKAERREIACDAFGAHVLVDPAPESPFDVCRALRAKRSMWGPAVIFECVGAAVHTRGLVRHAGPIASGRLDPLPSVGSVITLDEVPDTLELARNPRVHRESSSTPTGKPVTEREDRQDITEVLTRYATGIDRRDWGTFASMFTEDCQLDYGEIGTWQGGGAVVDTMTQMHTGLGHTMHRLSSVVITVDGDTAQARTYVDGIVLLVDNQSGVNALGFYDDDLVRTEAGWRVSRREFTPVRIAPFGQS